MVDEGGDVGSAQVGVRHTDELGTLIVVASGEITDPQPAAGARTAAADDPDRRFILTLGCPDGTGIVARISAFLAEVGGWITEAAYHSDPDSGWFFTRQAVRADSVRIGVDAMRERFASLAAEFGPDTDWRLTDTAEPKAVVLLVSKESHCLTDLLGRAHRGELPARIDAVVGNHADLAELTERFDVPFHHVPFPTGGKVDAFADVARIVDGYAPEAVVLARFMQILPPQLCDAWSGRAINIHHSFLPSFVGARPYHQAFARGVKLIGATCHYVTADLDAGPIIEQDVVRVDHSDGVSDMVRQGRDIETLVLARGLRWHLEDRVLVHGRKTVVFV
ncbi:formyltetrahydrofolate deformylase [Gordonia sinesedis]